MNCKGVIQMVKVMMSLKNIYKLLMNNDFPIYSASVISEADRKGQTMLRFWHAQLVEEYRCLPNGKMIWKNDGKRNRYTSHLCNRNTEMKCYKEYAMEIASMIHVTSLLHQISKYIDFLQRRKYRHDILLRRIRELIRLAEIEDPYVTEEVAKHVLDGVQMPEWLQQCGVPGSLFQAAYLLTILTLYSAASEEMGSTAMAILRSKEFSMKELWEAHNHIDQMKKKTTSFLTIHSSLLQDNPLPVHCFFGRESELFDLKEMASTGRKCLISGIGGIGKTETLKQLIRLCIEEKVVDKIAVIPYESSIVDSFSRCFKEFDTQDYQTSFHSIMLHLQRECSQNKVLLLIDNLTNDLEEDPELKQLLDLDCTILITTRRKKIDGFESYYLESPSVTTASLIFRDNYGHPLNAEDSQCLSEMLKDKLFCHPLTIRLMARAAKYQNWSVQELRSQLEEKGLNISWQEDRTVRLGQIYRQLYSFSHIPKECHPLVEVFTLLPRDSYSESFLKENFPQVTGNDVNKKLLLLKEGGWLDEDNQGWSMHPFTAQCLRHKVLSEQKLESLMNNFCEQWQHTTLNINAYDHQTMHRSGNILLHAVSFLNGSISKRWMKAALTALSAVEYSHTTHISYLKKMEQFMKHCDQKDDEIELLYYIASGRHHVGKKEDILSVYYRNKEQLTVSESLFFTFCHYAAETLMFLQDYCKADELFQVVIKSDTTPDQKASSYFMWGICAEKQGQLEEALRRSIQAKEYVLEHPGCSDHIRLRILSTTANNCILFGKKEEAGELLKEVQKLLVVKTTPLDLSQYHTSFGTYELYYGNLEKALDHYEKSIKLYEEYLGKDSTFYTIQGQIAIVLQRLKRYCEAEKVYLDLLNYAEKTQNYRLLQLFSNNLSVVYLELNQPEDALKHLKTALRLAREIGGITLAEALRNCARAYGLLNEDRKEYSSLKEAVPLLIESYGENHPRTVAAKQRYEKLNQIIKLEG